MQTEKLEFGLKIAKTSAIVLAAIGVLVYANSYSRSTDLSRPSINVSGTGKVIAKPDVARFTYAVKTEGGKDIATLKKDNDTRANKIIDFLKSQGVPKEDIKTTSYSLDPRYQGYSCGRGVSTIALGAPEIALAPAPCPPSEIVGYSFNNTVEVTVRDFEKKDLSGLLSSVVSNGADSVSQLRFELDDPTDARLLAKAEAITKAKAEAKRLSKESGLRLGKILSVDDYGSPMPYLAKGFGVGGGGDMVMTESVSAIEAGSQEITVTINIRYALK